jgi:DNA-binding beta-propeller fold protein YncE
MRTNHYIFLLCLGFCACVKDKPGASPQPVLELSKSKKVYVINEGGFEKNNAGITLYDPGTGAVIENFYQSQNQTVMGDVAQDLIYYNSSFYIVMNNSQKVIVCDEQMKNRAFISGLNSPRYILPVTNSKAYVSDFKANAISVVNLNSNAIVSTIGCSGWTEKMALIYNKVFVTNMRTKYLYVINTINDSKTDSIEVGSSAGNILIDRNDRLWVLNSGDPKIPEPGTLKRINPVSHAVEKTFVFALNESPGSLCMNKTKDTLYFLNSGGICRMGMGDASLPAAPFISKGSRNYYGLGIDPNTYQVYAADALDYVQRSNVYIFDANGSQKSFFKAGIISNGFYFE